MEQFSRTKLLYGESFDKIYTKRVAIFGIGGVGGHAVEALVRSGVGEIDLYDNDIVSISNLNRQIVATYQNIGLLKVDAMENRLMDINPNIKVNKYPVFYTKENADFFDLTRYDYVLDAVDTITAKIELAKRCYNDGIKIISSMGAGNKIEPSLFEITDIFSTSVCPLAKVMRKELKRNNIPSLKVVYSKEIARKPLCSEIDTNQRKQIPGSNSFVPAVAGLIMAGEVINDLINIR